MHCSGLSGLQTGSFQNQTTSLTTGPKSRAFRKRGIAAALQDATNLIEGGLACKRRCLQETATKIKHHVNKYAPRGNPSAITPSRMAAKEVAASLTVTESEQPINQPFWYIYKHNKSLYNIGKEGIENYIQRNTEWAIQKASAIRIMTTALSVWGKSILEAAKLAADVTGFSAEVVRRWAASYFTSLFEYAANPTNIPDAEVKNLLSSDRGHSSPCPQSLIHDEDFQQSARAFVRSNANKKGEPNLTVHDFASWVRSTYSIDICDETARLWLHNLGFSQQHHHKGVYFDGHEREDVVAYRKQFLDKLAELDRRTITSDGIRPELEDGEKPLIRVVHDESTFYANASQTFSWCDGETQVLRQKSLGAAIMVSDHVDEVGGYLCHNQKEARLLLETQKDGYFNNEMFLEQVDKAVDVFEEKYPHAQALFMFDNAPSHCKCPDDALNADHMNVFPGGKQPVMRDSIWNGKVQKMVLPDGRPKGMRLVLQERGVDTKGMNADKLKTTIASFPDFQNPKTLVEEKVESRGHLCIFPPKFHCELNAIERCWCHSKNFSRAHCNGSITRLRPLVPQAQETVTTDMIHKFFKTCRDYEKAYRDGRTCRDVDAAVKVY